MKSLYCGVFFVSMAVLALQVLLTRLFSFSMWYHFSYLTINFALLGFGASGTAIALSSRYVERHGRAILVGASALGGLFTMIMIYYVSRHPFELDNSLVMWKQESYALYKSIASYYFVVSLPFFFAGIAIAAALRLQVDNVSRLYFWDLLGAALGALFAPFLINFAGVINGIIICAAFFLVGAICFQAATSKLRSAALVVAGVVPLILMPSSSRVFEIKPEKTTIAGRLLKRKNPAHAFSKWTAINRVDVFCNVNAGWAREGISDQFSGPVPRAHKIVFDAQNATDIYQFTGSFDAYKFLDHHLLGTPYLFLNSPNVLVVGSGGGIDVINALMHGARSVTGVELQPVAVRLIKEDYAEWTGRLFNDNKRVRLLAGEGRHFVKRETARYDFIMINDANTFAAVNSGAYVLNESYLYTTDAIVEYYDHLAENGMLCILTWDEIYGDHDLRQPTNSRLLNQYLSVLRQRGASLPAQHLMVVGKKYPHPQVFTCPLLKKTPFTEAEVEKLRKFAAANGFTIMYDPFRKTDNYLERLITASDAERRKLEKDSLYDIRPVTDDRPFFYSWNKWSNLLGTHKNILWRGPAFGQVVLLIMLMQSIVFAVITIVIPLVLKRTGPGGSRITFIPFLAYFLCLGVGFMFIEIGFIQRFVLFLGYPAYAVSVTLFSLLVSSGIGSWYTTTGAGAPEVMLKRSLISIFCLIPVYVIMVPLIIESGMGMTLPWRIAITMAMQVPIGLILGTFFPLGIMIVRQINPDLAPWAWAANGVGSVGGTVIAILLAMLCGFRVVALSAMILYLFGTSWLLWRLKRNQLESA